MYQPRRNVIVSSVAVLVIFLFAALPWAVEELTGPLLPAALLETPSAYVVLNRTAIAATRVAERDRPMRVILSGTSAKSLSVYRCPQGTYKTTKQLPETESFDIFGWSRDATGKLWFLTADEIDAPQEWVRSDDSVKVIPENYQLYYAQPTPCRL